MARADTPTLLSLDRFAAIAGLHPLHFNQVYVADIAPTVQCDMTILQHSWQMNDGVSREEIALAISQAESMLEMYLGYSVAPTFYDEIVLPRRTYRPELARVAGFYHLRRGMVQSGGVRGTISVQAGATVVYSDVDGDGYDETATVTVVTDVDIDELAVYYPDKGAADTTWRIRPVQATRSGGSVALVFSRHQCLLETLQEGLNAQPADGLIDANFLEEVDVYRVYLDPSVQAQLFYYNSCGSCGDTGCAQCAYTELEGCISVVDGRLGQVHVESGTYDLDTSTWAYDGCAACGLLFKVRMRYLAGVPLEGQAGTKRIASRFEMACARLAMVLLDRPICTCESIQAAFDYWNRDMAQTTSGPTGSDTFQLAQDALSSPFGTTRGGIQAFKLLRERDRVPV